MPYHKTLFVFDIETIPDLAAAKRLLKSELSPLQLREEFTQYHLNSTKNPFIRQLFHQIIAISFLEAEIHYHEDGSEYYILRDIRSGGKPDSKEADLIQGFFQYLSSLKARLVSFNGKTFDMPVLKYRAMLHNVEAKWLYNNHDKWNNYQSRYSADWHCDLLEVLSDYGQSARVKLSEICALLSLPGKIGMDGSQVEEIYHNGQTEQIRQYCELDVINTYLVYLKHMLHIGNLRKDSYLAGIDDLTSFLQSEAHVQPHFQLYLDQWNPKI